MNDNKIYPPDWSLKASKVRYQDADYEWVESRDEYAEVGSVKVTQRRAYWEGGDQKVRTTIYLHAKSGLIVADVAAFEGWLNQRRW